MIRMNKNESPIKPLSTETLTELIEKCDYHLYPDVAYDRFRKAYARNTTVILSHANKSLVAMALMN